MRKRISLHAIELSVFFLLVCFLTTAASAFAADFYVATNGNDSWSGSLVAPNTNKTNGPFATLERARNEIQKLKARGSKAPVTVWVRGGVYSFTKKFTLGLADSGLANAPVSFRAYNNEKPVLTGSRRISGFKPYKGQILQADVRSQGLENIYFRQLYFNEERQPLARYPNFDPANPYYGGWAYVDGTPVNPNVPMPGESKRVLKMKPRDVRAWAHPEDGEVFIFPHFNYWNNILPIASIDQANHSIILAADASYTIRPGDRYYVRNLLEELDAPGEWYLDKRTWVLYFWPPVSPTDSKEVVAYAPVLDNIMEIDDASNVVIRGFTIEGSTTSAILLKNTNDCLVAGNTIRNVGGSAAPSSAVEIRGGTHNGIVGNDIYEVGGNAVTISGGDRKTLTPAGNYADNNYIHHTGVFYKQGVGITLDGVGNRASHNLIHDTPRFGIIILGNDQIVEYNIIHHVSLETQDTGAIYTNGRDWLTPRGSIIRYNYIHDSVGFGFDWTKDTWVSPFMCWGIYLDDNSNGVDVIGNIVVRAVTGLVHMHNARDSLFENNIFVNGTQEEITFDGWAKEYGVLKNLLPSMTRNYEEYDRLPQWRKYRGFADNPPQNAIPMGGNQFLRNIYFYFTPGAKLYSYQYPYFPFQDFKSDFNIVYHFNNPILFSMAGTSAADQWKAWQQYGFDRHSIIADPLFLGVPNGDYRLKPESPAFRLGFQRIPIEKIGLYKDVLRASWPVVGQ